MKMSFNFIRKLSGSRDGKTIIENFGYLTLLQVAGYVFPLITMPYLARVIGAEGLGKIAFASSIVVWMQTISDWGFNLTATRDVAQNRENKEKVSRIFSNILWSRCVLTLFSGLLLLIAITVIPYLRENAEVILITFLLIPGNILFPEWFFQAVEKMKYTTIFNVLLKLLFTIAVFLFIKNRDDYILQPLFTTIGYLICGLGALYLILYKWGFTLCRPNLKEIVNTIKGGTDVFINNLMPNLYNSFSVMLLGLFGGAQNNGLYDVGNKLPTVYYQFQSILSRVFFPYLSRCPNKHSTYARINMFVALVGAILLAFISPWGIRIMFGAEFEKSIVVMQIMSFSLIFLAMSYTYGANYLIIHRKEKSLRNLTFIVSSIGMCASVPLVFYFSYIGAAVTVFLCRGLLGIGSFVLAKKVEKTI